MSLWREEVRERSFMESLRDFWVVSVLSSVRAAVLR